MPMSDPDFHLADPLHRGVELHELQIWRDAESENVIIQVPEGLRQVVFTPAQWRRMRAFLDGPEALRPPRRDDP